MYGGKLRMCHRIGLVTMSKCLQDFPALISSKFCGVRPNGIGRYYHQSKFSLFRSQNQVRKYSSWTEKGQHNVKDVKHRVKTKSRAVGRDMGRSLNQPSQETRDKNGAEEKKNPNLMEDLFDNIVSQGNCKHLTISELEAFDEFVKENYRITNWSVRFAEFLSFHTKKEGILELCLSLIKFIEMKSPRMNPLIIRIIEMQVLLSQLGREAENKVLGIYKDLCEEYDVFDAGSLGRIMNVLCQTKEWKQCLSWFEMYNLTAKLRTYQLSPIIAAAVRHGDMATAHDLLETVHAQDETPLDQVFMDLVDAARGVAEMEELLILLQNKEWIVSKSVVDRISTWFNSQPTEKWKGQFVRIKKANQCPSCRSPLEPLVTLSPEEFTELRDQFLERSVVKRDVFQNTSPAELAAFTADLDRHGPYDVVLDALNTVHGTRQGASRIEKANVLHEVVHHFAVTKDQKVFVLGRRHMENWPKMDQVRDMAHCFFAQDSSEDDPFMLYAALSSGPQTIFVTRDHFRDHRTLLGPRLAQRFKHWQLSRQVPFLGKFPSTNSKQKSHLKFKWPNKYHTRTQRSPDGWHIPYDDGVLRPSYEVPNTWLCLVKL